MTLAKEILAVLPKLRRFGHMLIGSQSQADTVVKICLQTLIDNPKRIKNWENPVVVLFALFLTTLNDTVQTHNFEPKRDGLGELSDELLAGLLMVERQVFLLRYTEEFSKKDTAKIMGVTKIDVRTLESRIARKMTNIG